jgi:hypothetical protein
VPAVEQIWRGARGHIGSNLLLSPLKATFGRKATGLAQSFSRQTSADKKNGELGGV